MKGPGFYGQEFFSIRSDEELIRENIIRVLLTSPGERVMSNFGCNLKSYLFEQSNILLQEIEDEIKKSINRWEPRVLVNNILIEEVEENTVRLKIDCTIKENLNTFSLNTTIRV